MLDLSMIIPIYNTPVDDLQRCFDSVQTVGGIDYEVLLIDDGSQPFVGAFCTAYAEEHPAFRYIRKENGGVSSARNLGLDNANGQYVMFVDADDEVLGAPINGDCLTADCDLVLFDMFLSEDGHDTIWPSLSCDAGKVDVKVFLKHLIVGKSLNSPCVKMFRRSVIEENKLRFRTDMVTGEDWLFVASFAKEIGCVHYVNAPCYRYFRDEGTGQTRTARFPDAMINNHITIMDFKRQLALEGAPDWSNQEVIGPAAAMHVEDMFNTAAELLLFKLLTKERKTTIRDCVKRTGPELQYSGSKKAKIKRFVLISFPVLLWPLAKMREFYLKHKH